MPVDPENLQFDQVELSQAGLAPGQCVACASPIAGAYYEIGGKITCALCHERVLAALFGKQGRWWRFIRALAAGAGAGLVGAGIYFGVAKATGYEIGLVAIVVGILVGIAVRKGSRGRGGWFYQLLAVLLTYCAMVSTYIPMILQGFGDERAREVSKIVNDPTHETVKVAITKEAKVEMSGREVTPDELREELQRLKGVDGIVWLYDGAAKEGADLPEVQEARQAIDDLALPVQKFYDREFQEPRLTSDPEGPVSGKAFIFAGAALLLLALILPFLLLPGNIMGLIILGIGVWQAWRINRRPVIPISGPYQTGGPAPSVPTTPTWQG